MQGTPRDFWGKLRRTVNGAVVSAWHPLIDHCADVAAVAEALLALPVWRTRLGTLAGRELSPRQCARLAVLAALHDLGKFNIGFQAKGRGDLGPTAGHVSEAVAALAHGAFPSLVEIADWGDAIEGLLLAAIAHHGRPIKPDNVSALWQPSLWEFRAGLDPQAGIRELLECTKQWFPLAWDSDAELPEGPGFSHAFAGLITLADWIGSDDLRFRFTEEDQSNRIEGSRQIAGVALKSIGLDVPPDLRRDRVARGPFARIAPPQVVQPRPVQMIAANLPLDLAGSITVIESETGSGKTEAALSRFVALFEAGLVDGLYFALPTRSAATQMHRRVVSAATQAFESPPPVVLAVPGYLRVDEANGTRVCLPRFEVQWPDTPFRHRAWASEHPKRFLAGTIAVGTVDQVLLSALAVSHAHLRAAALLRHLLVVDEVHASDAYMTEILEAVLAHHAQAGGHALLLSATLGGETRARLLQPGGRAPRPTLQEAINTPYPLVTHQSAMLQGNVVTGDTLDREIVTEVRSWMEFPAELADEATAAAANGAKVLIVRNTVGDCLATQLAVESAATALGRPDVLFRCRNTASPHHARYARTDREVLDAELERQFGRERKPGGIVAVATQTVQQSLDIDADALYSDLCPADVLLQRIGRLHRHDRVRPGGFESPKVVVLVPASRDLGRLIDRRGVAHPSHGLGSVYPDLRVIEATWRLIEASPVWRIPSMNRLLVERSVHTEALAAIVIGADPNWQAHQANMIGTHRGQARLAELNIVNWASPYADSSFPTAADQRISTRLGEGDRLVSFSPALTSPFGMSFDQLTVLGYWAYAIDPMLKDAERVRATPGGTRFDFGGRPFLYDRLGLRPDAGDCKEAHEDGGP